VVANLADPLDLAKKSMQGKVAKYEAAEKAKADAARLAAEEQARKEREAAEKERARLQAEADELHRQEVAAAEAKAKADAEELAAVLGKPVEAKPVEVAPAPKIELPATPAPAPVAVAEPAKPSAVQVRNVPVLVIDDPKLVPAYVGGQELRTIDRAAVKRAIEAGATVPGARIEMQPQTAMARQR
jgi:ATPase subunit of ABC transporter with duplicated ATPase domains